MCGIFGYVGHDNATTQLLNGIAKLEYRGYDSAGIAVTKGNELVTVKTKGRIDDLKHAVHQRQPQGNIGLAHTRWATHGEVTQANAHPHTSGDIAIVHNGIIENHEELRNQLKQHGYTFTSDTDSETIAHLINHYYEDSISTALTQAHNQLKGNYAIAAIKAGTNTIIATRHDSPLVIGTTDNATYLSSDEGSFADQANKIAYPEEDTIIKLTPQTNTIIADNNQHTPQYEQINENTTAITKNDHETYMHKEIHEQPQALRRTLRNDKTIDLSEYEAIYLTGCGTSLNACRIGEHLLENKLQIPVQAIQAGEFRYRNLPLAPETAVIGLSQSGETADTKNALKHAKEQGADTYSLVNEERSAIARLTDDHIGIKAGKEVGVASTKAYTTQLTTLYKLIQHDDLKQLPVKINTILQQENTIKQIAHNYHDIENILYLGRGINRATAFEGALKLKEISYIHAEGYSAAELKHGPLALIDDNVPSVFIANDDLRDKTTNNMEEVKARGGPVIAIADEPIETADHTLQTPPAPATLTPVLNAVTLQLFAYHMAHANQRDIDKPRNLAKCVTVE